MSPALARYFHDRGLLVEGIAAFRAATDALDAAADGRSAAQRALGVSLRALGDCTTLRAISSRLKSAPDGCSRWPALRRTRF